MNNFKELAEKRAELLDNMNEILDGAKKETRAMTSEELEAFNEIKENIGKIDESIRAEEERKQLEEVPAEEEKEEEKENMEETRAMSEERAFEAFIRGQVVEERADVNFTVTDGQATIPTSIADRIIKKVYDICPIYQKAEKFNVKGNLSIPYYDESKQAITMAYSEEFVELESAAGKFTNIELTGYLAGALAKVSKSLANNSKFDIVSFVVNAMAETIARFIEKELLNGTDSKVEGLRGVTNVVTAGSATAIVADDVIKLKDAVKDAFQNNGMFICSSNTRTALRLLKDANGRYMLQDDLTSPFGTTFLGKPVYVSDQMGDIASGQVAMYYGDFSGLAVKLSEEASVEVLRERFATQHAIGVVAWMEFDAKVQDVQKIAKLQMA